MQKGKFQQQEETTTCTHQVSKECAKPVTRWFGDPRQLLTRTASIDGHSVLSIGIGQRICSEWSRMQVGRSFCLVTHRGTNKKSLIRNEWIQQVTAACDKITASHNRKNKCLATQTAECLVKQQHNDVIQANRNNSVFLTAFQMMYVCMHVPRNSDQPTNKNGTRIRARTGSAKETKSLLSETFTNHRKTDHELISR